MSGFADQLRHGSHGTVYAPGTGFEQDHGNESQHGGSEHHAVKAERELGYSGGKECAVIGPMPWKFKSPQQSDSGTQFPYTCKYQISVP